MLDSRFKELDHRPMVSLECFLPPPVSKAMLFDDVPQNASNTLSETPCSRKASFEPRCSPAPVSAMTSEVQVGPCERAAAPEAIAAMTNATAALVGALGAGALAFALASGAGLAGTTSSCLKGQLSLLHAPFWKNKQRPSDKAFFTFGSDDLPPPFLPSSLPCPLPLPLLSLLPLPPLASALLGAVLAAAAFAFAASASFCFCSAVGAAAPPACSRFGPFFKASWMDCRFCSC